MIKDLVSEFFKDPNIKKLKLDTSDGAFNRCKYVSSKLIIFLKLKGIEARLVKATGFKRPFTSTTHPSWVDKFSGSFKFCIVHYAVLVGDFVIDLTGVQFGIVSCQVNIKSAKKRAG